MARKSTEEDLDRQDDARDLFFAWVDARGITAETLAGMTDVPFGTIQGWRNNGYKIDPYKASTLVSAVSSVPPRTLRTVEPVSASSLFLAPGTDPYIVTPEPMTLEKAVYFAFLLRTDIPVPPLDKLRAIAQGNNSQRDEHTELLYTTVRDNPDILSAPMLDPGLLAMQEEGARAGMLLRELRKICELSEQEVADKQGCSVATIQRREYAQRVPRNDFFPHAIEILQLARERGKTPLVLPRAMSPDPAQATHIFDAAIGHAVNPGGQETMIYAKVAFNEALGRLQRKAPSQQHELADGRTGGPGAPLITQHAPRGKADITPFR